MTVFALPSLPSPTIESSSDDDNKYLMVGRACGADDDDDDDDELASLVFGRPGVNAATSGSASTATADNAAIRNRECGADLAIVEELKESIVLNAETMV